MKSSHGGLDFWRLRRPFAPPPLRGLGGRPESRSREIVGQKFQFKANKLAAPYATPATARRSTTGAASAGGQAAGSAGLPGHASSPMV